MNSKIAIFASGKGSNAKRLIDYFADHPTIEVVCVICNRKSAGVFDLAKETNAELLYFPGSRFQEKGEIVREMKKRGIDWIVLAGFLLKVPQELINEYRAKILNIHPALLPKFGGKGMYGDHVHEAVLEAGEKKSGISIHLVDEEYDTGALLAQFECEIDEGDDLDALRAKISGLEKKHLPKVVETLINEHQKQNNSAEK